MTTTVIKLGGAEGIGADHLLDELATRPTPAVLVHGGSDEATRLQAALGRPAEFLESPSGQTSRRTDRAALEAFVMATALVNRRLVESLQGRGVDGFGLSGVDGRVLEARRKPHVRAVVDGRVRVLRDEWTGRPERVDAGLLRLLLERGSTPVLAPIGCGERGELLNVDGDRAAAAVGAALGAPTLVILTAVPGLLRDVDDPESLVPHLDRHRIDEAEALALGRMRKKVLAAREALDGGVERVVIADARVERPLESALAGRGTVLGTPLDPIGSAPPAHTDGGRS